MIVSSPFSRGFKMRLLRCDAWGVCEHTLDDLVELRLVCVEVEGGEEAQRAEVEGHNWGDTLL